MLFSGSRWLTIGLVASALPGALSLPTNKTSKYRTVITTDVESDDLASLVRYFLYANELDTEGIIYASSRFHWAGDGKGTKFFLPGREYTTPQTAWRWVGSTVIEDLLMPAYTEVYPNLRSHDPGYPTPEDLLSKIKVGDIMFEGEMEEDTDGSNLIQSLLLDDDPRTLYLQAWGGTSTIARALKSIEEQYANSTKWSQIQSSVSRKAVILASGFQDETYFDYIGPNWPQLRVENFQLGYATWSFNCNITGAGDIRPPGLPEDNVYFKGAWIKENIQIGPLGKHYRSWLDGQTTQPGDQIDFFGNYTQSLTSTWCQPLELYDFLSEGDNVVVNPLLNTGIQDPSNPALGSWGGRSVLNSSFPGLWQLTQTEKARNGTEVENYTFNRWISADRNDFAARMQWTFTPKYEDGNHAPSVTIVNGDKVQARPGSTVQLSARTSDPDRNQVTVSWWQYPEEGTYPGKVTITGSQDNGTSVMVPSDAKSGETISIIAEATDDGDFPLTRYARVFIHII